MHISCSPIYYLIWMFSIDIFQLFFVNGMVNKYTITIVYKKSQVKHKGKRTILTKHQRWLPLPKMLQLSINRVLQARVSFFSIQKSKPTRTLDFEVGLLLITHSLVQAKYTTYLLQFWDRDLDNPKFFGASTFKSLILFFCRGLLTACVLSLLSAAASCLLPGLSSAPIVCGNEKRK